MSKGAATPIATIISRTCPPDLGFYDLAAARSRAAQASLRALWGVEGFCYYHYWFGGRRILERPFEEYEHGEPDLPFGCAGRSQLELDLAGSAGQN